MATFDAKAFGKALLAGLKERMPDEGRRALEDVKEAREALDELEKRIEATVSAMQSETDPERLKGLQDDLTGALYSSRKSIESVIASKLSGDLESAAKTALDVAIHVAITVGKSFLPFPIPNLGK